jgi:hypothetical protein
VALTLIIHVGCGEPQLIGQHQIRVLTDRELYVPKSWIGDRGRCGEAGIGDDVRFATKPELARKMIGRAVSLGLPFAWFTADEAYGDNGRLREWLAENTISYVVAVSCDHRVPAGAGKTIRADHLAAKVPGRGWQRLSCGPGSKGERLYDWALAPAGQGRTLLIRRSRAGGEHAYYLCWSPRNTTLSELVRVAGARWAVEECFQAAKNETALDHYQVRKHQAWYGTSPWRSPPRPGSPSPRPGRPGRRPATAARPERGPPACGQPSGPLPAPGNRLITVSDGQALTCLSVNEIRRMHATLCRPAHPPEHHLHWSRWRRRHQAIARQCHYQRRRQRGSWLMLPY